jgi:hypothetical protein
MSWWWCSGSAHAAEFEGRNDLEAEGCGSDCGVDALHTVVVGTAQSPAAAGGRRVRPGLPVCRFHPKRCCAVEGEPVAGGGWKRR